MKKIFYVFLSIFYILFINWEVFATQGLDIISRDQWWADEEYRYRDSEIWKEIIKKQTEKNSKLSEKEAKYKKETLQKEIDSERYLQTFFWKEQIRMRIRTKENNRELAWPIEHSKYIKWIVIHHTVSDDPDMKQAVRDIYKFHAVDRKWWDIWYNFLIWKNWEIYEWRAWGEKTIAWHDKWNNVWNIGIAIIWDYTEVGISKKQKRGLQNLMKYLIQKYEIDLNQKTYFHKECREEICNNVLESKLFDPIIGHRNAWHTTCPGEKLYRQLTDIHFELRKTMSFTLINQEKLQLFLEKFSDQKLIKLEKNLKEKVKKWLQYSSIEQTKITFFEEILYGIDVYFKN